MALCKSDKWMLNGRQLTRHLKFVALTISVDCGINAAMNITLRTTLFWVYKAFISILSRILSLSVWFSVQYWRPKSNPCFRSRTNPGSRVWKRPGYAGFRVPAFHPLNTSRTSVFQEWISSSHDWLYAWNTSLHGLQQWHMTSWLMCNSYHICVCSLTMFHEIC